MKVNNFYTKLNSNTSYKSLRKCCFALLVMLLQGVILQAQYVHPNQAGRQGGDTGPGIGNQVVTSTYIGSAGDPGAQGVLFSVNKDGTNKAVLHDFDGFPGDGSYPFYTTPHQASDGNLYGSSYIGGTQNLGTVYRYDGACDEDVIFNNTVGAAGTGSVGNYANVNELSDGKLYAVMSYGGTYNLGSLLRMNKDGSNVEVIHEFSYSIQQVAYSAAAQSQLDALGLSSLRYDGGYVYGFVVEGADGKIYGSTLAGGALAQGTWWRCNKDGSDYEIIRIGDITYRTNYQTGTGSNISAYGLINPWGNVAQDQDGKIYITGYSGGANNLGGQGRMNPDGSDYELIHSGSLSDGSYPYRGATIIDDKVYGTFRIHGGGTSIGVVYSMNLNGTNYQKLKTFDATNSYGSGTDPWAGLSYDGTFLYGTTITNGGPGVVGTIFKLRPDGSDFETIHRFRKTAGGACDESPGLFAYYPSAERVTFANVDISCAVSCVENQAPSEICNNGIDEDGDGLIDCDDPDCGSSPDCPDCPAGNETPTLIKN